MMMEELMETYLTDYLSYLGIEKNCSPVTITCYRSELQKFIPYVKSKDISNLNQINTSLLRKYIIHIKETRNLSNVSLYSKIAMLKSYFNFLEEENSVESNPSRKIRFPKKERPLPKVVSEEDFEKIISCIKFSPRRCRKNFIRDSLIFYMLYYCGLRRCELLNLNWDDISLGKDLIYLRSSKNKKGRIIPIHPKVKEYLDLYLEQRLPMDNRALIIGEMGKRLTITSFTILINRYFRISGVKRKGYTAHSLRHYVECYIMVSEAVFA